MNSKTEHHKGFEGLLAATGELIAQAIEGSNYSALASAAVMNSALLIEAAANCCIYELSLNNKLSEEVDRLPSLTKFDFFLLVKSGGDKTLDRGTNLYQDVKEIKKLRDLLVHPKTTKITRLQFDEDKQVGQYDRSPRLGISLGNDHKSIDDAICAFKVVNMFLNDFFTNDCQLQAREIRLLLLAPLGDDEVTDWFVSIEELEMLQERFDIPLAYVGVGVDPHDEDHLQRT